MGAFERLKPLFTKGIAVVGVDPGQVNLGSTLLRCKADGSLEVAEYALQGRNTFKSRFELAGLYTKAIGMWKPDLVVIEDYTMQLQSMVAFGMGEFGGLLRLATYNNNIPFILNAPNSMRSFCGIVPRTKSAVGKEMIFKWLYDEGFVSEFTSWLDRSNASDALVHAIIGHLAYTLSITEGVEGKGGLIRMLLRECEWHVVEKLTNDPTRWVQHDKTGDSGEVIQ